ncbi:MAG TPA: hypothetical protein VM888_02670, partial [Chitinophagaceae bacterium]|nr:hypothetical protein [Chitinophagaceae bacterium]
VSPDFNASDYIYDKELASAIQNKEQRKIQILLRPVFRLPLQHLQAIPPEKPICDWTNKDEAWVNVRKLLEPVFEAIRSESPLNPSDGSNRGASERSEYSYERQNDFRKTRIPFLLIIIALIACVASFVKGWNESDYFFTSVSLLFLGSAFIVYFLSKKFSPLPLIPN